MPDLDKLARELFHPLENLIDAHIEAFKSNEITEGCYFDKEFEKVYRHVAVLVIEGRIAEVKNQLFVSEPLSWQARQDKRIAVLESDLSKMREGKT